MSLPAWFSPPLRVLIVLIIAFGWCVNMEHRVLQHPDEGRYAEIAREMAVTGNWITPRLNGFKYFEKPPLQYWLTAALFRAFGPAEWTARLVPLAAGLGAAAAIAWTGGRLGGPLLAWAAGLLLAGTLGPIALAQIVTLDSLLCGLLTAAFGTFVVAQRAPDEATRRRCMLGAWLAIALAVLTKGPVALMIPVGALLAYVLVQRDASVLRRLELVRGGVLFAAITAPWFVAVSLANPEFAQFFFIHEHVQRYLTTGSHRPGHWWYFVPLFLAGSMPWLTILAGGFTTAWRGEGPGDARFSWQRFALCWAGFVFVFFTLSGSKLPSYILPMFGPLALLCAWLALRMRPRTLAFLVGVLAVAATVLASAALLGFDEIAAYFADARQPTAPLLAFAPWLQAAFVAAAIAAMLAVVALQRGERGRLPGILALSLGTLAAAQLLVAGQDNFRTTRSSYDILHAARSALAGRADLASPTVPFYQVRMYDQTAPFYLGRTTIPVEYKDELGLGIDAEPDKAIAERDEWIRRWRASAVGYALLSPADYEMLARQGVPMHVLARDPRRVLVSRL